MVYKPTYNWGAPSCGLSAFPKLPLFRRFRNGGSSPGTREEEKQLLLEAEQLLLARPKVDVVADAWASLVV